MLFLQQVLGLPLEGPEIGPEGCVQAASSVNVGHPTENVNKAISSAKKQRRNLEGSELDTGPHPDIRSFKVESRQQQNWSLTLRRHCKRQDCYESL